MTMRAAVIPWHVFIDGLHNQNPAESAEWLERWSFADSGVLARVDGRTGRGHDLIGSDNEQAQTEGNISLAEVAPQSMKCDPRLYSQKVKWKTPARKGKLPGRGAHPTKCKEQGDCERCLWGGPARYRALTDVMDMKVCDSCAAEANRLGIFVQALDLPKMAGSTRERRQDLFFA